MLYACVLMVYFGSRMEYLIELYIFCSGDAVGGLGVLPTERVVVGLGNCGYVADQACGVPEDVCVGFVNMLCWI